MPRKIFSFGYKHKPQFTNWLTTTTKWPKDALIIDVRLYGFIRNPYHNKRLRCLNGTDEAVKLDILKTPDFKKHYQRLLDKIIPWNGIILLGCTGGKHRSVVLAEMIADELKIPCYHLDINKK